MVKRVKAKFPWTDLVILVILERWKILSYSQINMVYDISPFLFRPVKGS